MLLEGGGEQSDLRSELQPMGKLFSSPRRVGKLRERRIIPILMKKEEKKPVSRISCSSFDLG